MALPHRGRDGRERQIATDEPVLPAASTWRRFGSSFMVPESERQPQIAAVPASRWRLLVPSVAQSRHAAIFRLPGPRQAVQRVGKFEPFQACPCARYPSVSHFTVMLRASCHTRCLTLTQAEPQQRPLVPARYCADSSMPLALAVTWTAASTSSTVKAVSHSPRHRCGASRRSTNCSRRRGSAQRQAFSTCSGTGPSVPSLARWAGVRAL